MLRDSYLRCPYDGKKLTISLLEEEGQGLVTHRCLACPYSERAPGQRPQRTDSPYMTALRERLWSEAAS